MKIALASDLHLDHDIKTCPYTNDENAEILVLAGDVCDLSVITKTSRQYSEAVDYFTNLSRNFEYILWVFGNHEFYKGDLATAVTIYRQFLDKNGLHNIRILDNESFMHRGVEFVGTTLWTDFNKGNPLVMRSCNHDMLDYKYITNNGKKLVASVILGEHYKCLEFLKKKLAGKSEKMVIITHHQPTNYKAIYEYGVNNPLNYAYYNELSDLIIQYTDRIPFWFSGHTHNFRDDFFEKTRLVTNCRGYFGYEATKYFTFKYFDL